MDLKLLVSVRNADEAKLAVEGGAHLIDVKEPSRGALGRASVETWRSVRATVPGPIPVSVALGEIFEVAELASIKDEDYDGIAFRKIGLAGARASWREDLAGLLEASRRGPRWVAVAYSDWTIAEAPDPDSIVEWALGEPSCAGLLIDTWEKPSCRRVNKTGEWRARLARVRSSGKMITLAGGIDRRAIADLQSLNPHFFGVRGAACEGSCRLATLTKRGVAALVEQLAKSSEATR